MNYAKIKLVDLQGESPPLCWLTKGKQCGSVYRLNTTVWSDIYKYFNCMFRPLWLSSGWI